jgi:predicted transcriptional regulator
VLNVERKAKARDRLSEPARRFVDDFGHLYARFGLTLTFGRVFALLLLSDRPLSLDEMARQLAVSKSGASVVARDLVEVGIARRLGSPGSRRVLYEASDTMEPIFEAQFGRVRATLPVLKRGEPHVPKGRARQRFRAMVDLHEFWLREGAGIIDRWQKTRRKP